MEHISETSVDEGQHPEVFVSRMLDRFLQKQNSDFQPPLPQWCAPLGAHFILGIGRGGCDMMCLRKCNENETTLVS